MDEEQTDVKNEFFSTLKKKKGKKGGGKKRQTPKMAKKQAVSACFAHGIDGFT